ncbi:MAG: response regulator transcription factor, partial [Actinomycetota bacterium]|nr:response regulator transcription factor [Actinomycetota bacterium]
MLRVLLADDQDLVRAGFRVILGMEDDIEVAGEAGDGLAAVDLATRLRPDVVLMDVQMPGIDGLEATRRVLAAVDTKVVILTTFDREDYLFEALRSGASGFLLKNASPEDLVDAVRVVARGDALLSPEVTRRVIARFSAGPAASAPAHRPPELTDREFEVLVQLARGATYAEIAAELY